MQEKRSRCLTIFLMLALIGCIACAGPQAGLKESTEAKLKAVYVSEEGKTLVAVFDTAADSVTLTLPEGRHLTLPRSISASGARYTDGKETFWEHHGESSYWVGDGLIFRGKAKD